MKQVTRNIDIDRAKDLLERAPRACLSFASDQGPQVQPVSFRLDGDRYLVNIYAASGSLPVSGQEVVLLVDEGIYYFELRAVYIRGRVQTAETSPVVSDGFQWFEVVPFKIIAWDYGAMREVGFES